MGSGAAFFPRKAQGSRVQKDGKTVGSALIGQDFRDGQVLPAPAVGHRLRPDVLRGEQLRLDERGLKKAYDERKAEWEKANGTTEVPPDMLFASGSGLDPHISPRAAELQVHRVAAARHLSADNTAKLLGPRAAARRGSPSWDSSGSRA